LWFAYKTVSLTYRTQPKRMAICSRFSCDLLTKLYLWHIGHNLPKEVEGLAGVVICLQNCIFDISDTTKIYKSLRRRWLWFAYKTVSLTYRTQLWRPDRWSYNRCDLLTKLYLWHIGHNGKFDKFFIGWVVICLQNCIFDISDTT